MFYPLHVMRRVQYLQEQVVQLCSRGQQATAEAPKVCGIHPHWSLTSVGKNSQMTNCQCNCPPLRPRDFCFRIVMHITHMMLRNLKDKLAFSGPLTSKPLSAKPVLSSSGPITSSELPQLVSGLLTRVQIPQPPSSPPKVSPSASPPIASSPKISELHELPRPPSAFASKPVSSSSGHSAPLAFRNQELSPKNKGPTGAFSSASPLPTPPLTIPRSFSIPSINQRAAALHVASGKAEEVSSPPLTPIALSHMRPLSTVSAVASHSGKIPR